MLTNKYRKVVFLFHCPFFYFFQKIILMKKLLLFIVLAFIAITTYSQSYFERFIEPEDVVFREAEYVIETEDHGFIISCCPRYIYENDMLIRMTTDGEITNRLVFQINGKNLRYCGLYKSPDRENEYLAIAVLAGFVTPSYIQTELAFLRLDSELNITSQNIFSLDEGYRFYTKASQKDHPRFVLGEDGIFTMAAHCLKTDGFCYIFAKMTSDGELLMMKEDDTFTEDVNFQYDLFAKSNGNCGMISWSNKDQGGEFLYNIDSILNCVRTTRLLGLKLKMVQTNPQYLDTTFKYQCFRGKGLAISDTSFLLTCYASYLKHMGGNRGYAHFVAIVNDSVDVLDVKIFDIANEQNPKKLVAGVKALSVTEDAIYHGGFNGHYGYYDLMYSPPFTPSRIIVSKFDRELNLIWRRFYGANDNSYEINVIQATEDGGCILTGVCALKKNPDYYLSYVLKLDADGFDSVDENGESIVRPYYCYPNPAKDNLNIEFSPDVQCQSVGIFTLDGRLIETYSETSEQTTISIENLQFGTYIMKVKLADGKEYSERIVKE